MNEPKLESTAPAETQLLYRIRGLKKSYSVPGGSLPVLRGLDLDIHEGEFLLVRGRSGIGKSTLLHILGLLDRPDSGSMLLRGEEIGTASRRRRASLRAKELAFVFQFFHLLPEFTAEENVLIPGQIRDGFFAWRRNRKAARARAAELLDLVGMAERIRHRPNELSGGERQRVALARALFTEPDVVFCDEPTGNLDVRTSDEIHSLLSRLSNETSTTMVVVTHDPGLAAYADREVELYDGTIPAVAPA